jgi:hypothetical protein
MYIPASVWLIEKVATREKFIHQDKGRPVSLIYSLGFAPLAPRSFFFSPNTFCQLLLASRASFHRVHDQPLCISQEVVLHCLREWLHNHYYLWAKFTQKTRNWLRVPGGWDFENLFLRPKNPAKPGRYRQLWCNHFTNIQN